MDLVSTKYVGWQPTIHRCVQNIGFSRRKVLTTVAWLDHLLQVRTSVTINEVYSLKCLLEFVSLSQLLQLNAIAKEGMKQESEISSKPVQSWSAKLFIDESAKWWEDLCRASTSVMSCVWERTFYAIGVVDDKQCLQDQSGRYPFLEDARAIVFDAPTSSF